MTHVGLQPVLVMDCKDDITTERSLYSQATWIIDMLGIYFDVIHGCLYNQSLVDVLSTGAGIESQYVLY